jgi:hypothetical protein
MAPFSHLLSHYCHGVEDHHVKKSKMRPRSVLRRVLTGAVSFACASLAGCEEPTSGLDDLGDGGFFGATGRVAVHTQSTMVPPLISSLSLRVGALEATSDREPDAAARITLSAPVDLGSTTSTSIADAPPATYGAMRLIALDALTVTTVTGRRIIIDFVNVPPIVVRCAGPGTYLALDGEIDMHLGLDFAEMQSVLTTNGAYPPLTPEQTITEPSVVSALLTALEGGLSVTCAP